MKSWSFGKVVLAVFLGGFLAIAAVCGFIMWDLHRAGDAADKANAQKSSLPNPPSEH